jgi:hypothetical protein
MKKLTFVSLGIALLIPVGALGQETAKSDAVTQASLGSNPSSTKPKTISGRVGENGRTITTANNNLWTIANPDVLKEHFGQQVKVKCQISSKADATLIQILSVRIVPSEARFATNLGDAAFRR